MARKIRIEYAGAAYHVMARGNQGRDIYADERDRKLWLETLGEACEKTGWRIHAWVMMNNHYHLLLETPEANLVAGMKWLQGTYTQRYNSRHEIFGHLFQGRYKAVVVEPEAGNYFAVVSTYVHLNPARAGLIRWGGAFGPLPLEQLSLVCEGRGSATRVVCDRASDGKPGAATRRAQGLRGVH